jgi:hypothetical protein
MEDSTGIVDMFSQATKYVYMEWLYLPLIPGHFFNSEHSPYLFLMFNFKKHRSMHCELLCNQLIPNTRDFEIMLTIVPIDGIGLSCVALEMSRTFLML